MPGGDGDGPSGPSGDITRQRSGGAWRLPVQQRQGRRRNSGGLRELGGAIAKDDGSSTAAAAVRWCGHATVGNDEASSRNGEEEEETEAEGGAQASAPIRSRRRSGPSVGESKRWQQSDRKKEPRKERSKARERTDGRGQSLRTDGGGRRSSTVTEGDLRNSGAPEKETVAILLTAGFKDERGRLSVFVRHNLQSRTVISCTAGAALVVCIPKDFLRWPLISWK
uniref:Uncharacterized protein n=1 Tax=Oryza barthii TaxID=65489 RepID=A0A0D3F902_9ORYZ